MHHKIILKFLAFKIKGLFKTQPAGILRRLPFFIPTTVDHWFA